MVGSANIETEDLQGRIVVVPGGTGGVGEGIVRAYLNRGATVVVPSRNEGKADHLRELLGADAKSGRLHFVLQDYDTFSGAEALSNTIVSKFGKVDDVVATIGGWWAGKPLVEVSDEDWQKVYVGLSTAHVGILRAFLPKISRTGAYTLILGGSAYTPVPGSSLMNMEQAGLLIMRDVVQLEFGDDRRIFSLVMGPIMTRHRHRGDPDWVTAEQVGEIAAGFSANAALGGVEVRLRVQGDVEQARALIEGASHAK